MREQGKLSIIIPAYNEGKIIYDNLFKTIDIISGFYSNFEIIAVNDGSKDNTREEIARAVKKDSRIQMVTSEKNHGKGHAIMAGVAESNGKYIAFVDADLELNPNQLEGFLNKMFTDNKDVVIGSKLDKNSELEYPLSRRIISIGYYIMLLTLFRLNVKDTQTGLKLFKAEAIKPVAHLIRTSGYAYDIELLVAINRRGYSIASMPVKVVYVRERGSRRIGISDIMRAFKDTWKIFYRVYFRHYYDV